MQDCKTGFFQNFVSPANRKITKYYFFSKFVPNSEFFSNICFFIATNDNRMLYHPLPKKRLPYIFYP
jgi:hypothetical protein